ncbi:calcitonin gene-related peptide type 1 receptor-like isoform X2 [Centruroides vittatus]
MFIFRNTKTIFYMFISLYFVKSLQPHTDKITKSEREYQEQKNKLNEEFLLQQIDLYWECRQIANQFNNNEIFCPAIFDGWICWNVTKAGHQASMPCPSPGQHKRSTGTALKNCLSNGQWETNYKEEEIANYDSCSFDLNEYSGIQKRLKALIENFSNLDKPPQDNSKLSTAYEQCIKRLVSTSKTFTGEYCTGTFDGWSCWNDTPAGDIAYSTCPDFILGFLPDRYAYKICNSDGTWYRHPVTNKTWSNYTTCVDREDLLFRQKINKLYIAGYSVSLVALLISLAIFFYFPSLQCIRITIHKNLFFSFIMNNMTWIIWYTEVVQHVEVLEANNIECQILHIVVHYFLVCNYFWMFCEGLHLHTLMVFAFVQENKIFKWFCVIGWVLPLILITIYSTVRASISKEAVYCWIEESPTFYIITVPVCISMLLNVIFLVNIVRVLVTKLRAANSPETHQTKKAVRATLILLPLLGLHYLVTPFRPDPGTRGEVVYEIIATIVTSFQGFCVALIFCFFNGEVVALWKKKWMRSRLNRGKDMRVSYAATTLSEVTEV